MAGLYVGVTDRGWYEYLSALSQLDEVNFWQPSGRRAFRVLEPGGLFLFKLHSPDDYIVGGGIYAHWSPLPVSLAWDAFGPKNGAEDIETMVARLARYSAQVRTVNPARQLAHQVGCILLEQPFFLARDQWIPIGQWAPNIVQGRSYDLASVEAQRIIGALRDRKGAEPLTVREEGERFGALTLVHPRLGQGSFRVLVTDAYQRRCAMTGERVLPALEAAHIRPYAMGGEHTVSNGLLLRRDLHALFDRGYLGVGPDHRILVSDRLRDEFHNGRNYYELRGQHIALPPDPQHQPDVRLLEWHASLVA